LEWEALFGIPHPALSVRRSDCHFATLASLDRSACHRGLSGFRRACGLGEDFALQGCPLRLPFQVIPVGHGAAAVSAATSASEPLVTRPFRRRRSHPALRTVRTAPS